MGVGVSTIPEEKKRLTTSVTKGWVGVQFPGKKRYVILE